MRRFKHSLSHYRLMSMDMGILYPVGCVEVLPGDSFMHRTSALVRVSPLVAPVMHPVTIRIHHWFVPNRIIWPGWEDFITGGADGLGGSAGTFPSYTSPAGGWEELSLMDYLGCAVGVQGLSCSALPVRAYNTIFNEFYRDQDLTGEVPLDTNDTPYRIAWEKDYLTAARPWPQKGPDVSMPLGVEAPVKTGSAHLSGAQAGMLLRNADGNIAGSNQALSMAATSGAFTINNQATGTPGMGVYPTNLYADLTNATAANVNDIRRAFALQRYAEARAQYGSRYTEYLRYLGVRSSDARLQRPEYLGGGKQTISFSEVLQTGPDTADEGVANLKGHGIAALRSARYMRFFEEHGHVLSLMSVRPKTMYTQCMDRMWSRRTKEDYYQRELEMIGQQEVYAREVYAASDANGGGAVWGYQNRYDEYRHQRSTVHGEFRSTLNYWHMARDFAAAPALNESFVMCDPTKRIHAVSTNQVLWVMVNHQLKARRMVNASGKARIM